MRQQSGPAFRIYCTIISLPNDRKRLIVHDSPDFTLEFDDSESLQIYIKDCLRDRRVYEN